MHLNEEEAQFNHVTEKPEEEYSTEDETNMTTQLPSLKEQPNVLATEKRIVLLRPSALSEPSQASKRPIGAI